MIQSKSYKTSDVVGYLRSVLENAKSYARLKLMVVGVQGIGKTTLLELLRQEGGSFKRKTSEHWARRMGNKNVNMKTGRGVSMSTVGVDIGDWTYEKKDKSSVTFGPVTFRTWDFGGQTEYYSTHQYFLSKRSLYIVMWKIADGQRGVDEIQQWLINIQARAPNSPVIIVGTHLDVVKDEFPISFSEYLQQRIRDKFINITDPEKCGLPKVLDTIEVSCKTRQNIKLLAHLLYDTAFSLKVPGSKTRLLEQKIPATYLALEDVIGQLSCEQRSQGLDPVLSHDQYEAMIGHELLSRHGLKFRDSAELSQATKFLHENGVVLHYDDATLRDLYFLDPQWLCDMLSHVVTIREINPFAKNGVMRLEDLKHVFKSSTAVSLTAKSYIVNLLNKFEVALTWDSRTLLIPSLLPSEQQMRSGIPGLDMRVKIPLRSRGWALFRGRRPQPIQFATDAPCPGAAAAVAAAPSRSRSVPGRLLLRGREISRPMDDPPFKVRPPQADNKEYEMTRRCEPDHSIQRLVLMSYFPSGFWSRLLTRILADDSVVEIVRSYFIVPDDIRQDTMLSKIFIEHKPEWVCWKTGLELRYLDTTLFSMKQVMPSRMMMPNQRQTCHNYYAMRLALLQDGHWTDLDHSCSSIVEILLPQDTVVIKRPVVEKQEGAAAPIGYQVTVLDPNPKSTCQLLSLAVEHVDTLLEDWYPSLGTRFLHTSEGRMLVTRMVPCPRCLSQNLQLAKLKTDGSTPLTWEGRSGTVAAEEQPQHEQDTRVYAFLVEECILAAFHSVSPHCLKHGDLVLGHIAPDTVFLDLDDRLRIHQDSVKRGRMIGRGAFGFVYEAVCKHRGSPMPRNVALKMLQPFHPGANASDSTLAAFKSGVSKWERDPMQYACKAYCTARQELNILLHLKHPHIVPLIGICVNPLSIVLELAPLGALDHQLKHFHRSGDKLPARVVQLIVLQIAKALEYLHQQHIIYRDLKSENVLVWQLPAPFSHTATSDATAAVLTKLADYGISRATLPTGAKGFGGTEGFMAPEMIKYNGEEEYTEKVDCFSFGMFLYELITLHQPFVGYETVKELILEGGRPPLTIKDLCYPTYMLDLMVVCWAHKPRDRPTASQIVSIASAPEFLHLMDAVSLAQGTCCAATIAYRSSSAELWLASCSGFSDRAQLHVVQVSGQAGGSVADGGSWHHSLNLSSPSASVTSMCVVNNAVWIGDNQGFVHAFCLSSYELVFSYKMEPDIREEPSPVRAIHFLPELNRSCVAMHNGRMFLCCTDVVPVSQMGGEGTFVMTELGSASCIHAVSSLHIRRSNPLKMWRKRSPSSTAHASATSDVVEIWCGESQGAVSVFTLIEGVVTSQQVLNHHDPVVENAEVLQLVCHSGCEAVPPMVWSFIYPGCHVYQWEVSTRSVIGKLDCSKLVPCSESLKTIAIDEHFSPGRCQVAAMALQERKLYVGTSWGCIIIAEADSMRPITVFRPFSEDVHAIIAVNGCSTNPLVAGASTPYLITIGKGYRSLIERYVLRNSRGRYKKLSGQHDHVELDYDNAADHEDINDQEETDRTMFALLWRPEHWLSD